MVLTIIFSYSAMKSVALLVFAIRRDEKKVLKNSHTLFLRDENGVSFKNFLYCWVYLVCPPAGGEKSSFEFYGWGFRCYIIFRFFGLCG